MKKLKPYREIINGDKVIIANRDTGSWIRISRQCRDIVCTACEFSLTNSEILESLADDEDRIYINELLKKLKELGVIGDEEKEEVIDVVYLLLTNRCNLKCIHCCADAAEKFGSKRGKRLQNLAELQCIFHIGLFVIRNF